MINQDLLDILRCPLNPSNARLRLVDDHLECDRCALRFLIKDGFPILVVEEAVLPAGCESINQLPCQCEVPKSNDPIPSPSEPRQNTQNVDGK